MIPKIKLCRACGRRPSVTKRKLLKKTTTGRTRWVLQITCKKCGGCVVSYPSEAIEMWNAFQILNKDHSDFYWDKQKIIKPGLTDRRPYGKTS